MDAECNFTYKGEGNQQPGRPASNLFVNFVYVPPNPASKDFNVTCRYSRFKKDLFYKKRISLQDAIRCNPVKIPLLDGRQVLLAIDQVISPKTIKKIEGEGMKTYDRSDYNNQNAARGDLYVSFEIVFPASMTSQQRDRIEAILKKWGLWTPVWL